MKWNLLDAKELRELTKLESEGHGTSFIVNKEDLDKGMTPASEEELNGAGGRPKTRIDKLLRDAALKSENNGKIITIILLYQTNIPVNIPQFLKYSWKRDLLLFFRNSFSRNIVGKRNSSEVFIKSCMLST